MTRACGQSRASQRRPQGGQVGAVNAVKPQPRRPMLGIQATLRALLVLLGWRRAVRVAGVRRSASRRGRPSLGRDASFAPSSGGATDAITVAAATAHVEPPGLAGSNERLLPAGAGGS